MNLRLALMLALLPVQAHAQAFPADRIGAAAAGDWNGDGAPDLALVVKPPADGDGDNALLIYLNKPDEARLEPVLSLPNFLWGSYVLYGQEPELAVLANGSLGIVTKNDSIGRDRWRQTLTVAYRNFDFVVAGYTFSAYDTIAEDDTGNRSRDCDLNVLTGKGKADGRPIAASPGFVLLKDWKDEIGRKACGYGE
ncbi:hypothetical protein LXM94_18790 [Rhizobium sp. TRM95111]|uniref:hypothetical protein n=1 Tax=Rhizobium alarense TaxID=2846851 RepID=UPI001F21130F|nr:hypothetical protein [Rhizobium alarense]MCF3642017.1 hypothetical protein [Rhizobium alarense]